MKVLSRMFRSLFRGRVFRLLTKATLFSVLFGQVSSFGVLGVSVPTAYAAMPTTMGYQGRLKSSSGSLLTGSYNFTFRIYATSTGGSSLWSETQTGVTVDLGSFAVQLGNVTPIPTALDFDQPLFLSTEVNGDGEMSPRVAMNAVPYARVTSAITGSAGAPSATSTGGRVYYDTANGSLNYFDAIQNVWKTLGSSSASGTLQDVTNAGSVTTNPLTFNGGTSTGSFVFQGAVTFQSPFTSLSSNSFVWGNATGTNTTSTNLYVQNAQITNGTIGAVTVGSLSATGTTSLQALSFTNASGASVTSTSLAVLGTVSTALLPNVDASLALGSASLRWNAILANATATSVTTTNLFAGSLVALASTVGNLAATGTSSLQALTFTNATGSSLFATTVQGTNGTFSSATVGALTATGTTALQALSFTNGSGTTLFVSGSSTIAGGLNAGGSSSFNNVSAGTLSVSGNTSLQGVTMGNATATSVTSTNLYATNAQFANLALSSLNSGELVWINATGTNTTSTNLYAQNFQAGNAQLGTVSAGSATVGSLTATGTTSLQGTTFTNATATSVTTTNLFASGVVSTTQLYINGRLPCLADGTNCQPSGGSDGLAQVSARGSFATTTLQLFGGFVGASSTVTSTLTVLGSSSFQSIAFTDAQGSNVTTTGLAVLGGVSTSLIPTLDAALSLGSASLRWNASLASVTATSVTTTNLFANSLYALASTVGSLTATGTTSLQALTFTNATGSSLFASTVQGTNGTFTTALVGGLTATGTTSLQGLSFTNATGTSVTTTNLFATNAQFGNVSSTSANFGSASVGGQLSAGSVSTSQLFVNGQAVTGSGSDTLASVSARGASATSTLQLYGGFIGASSTVTSTLTVLGSTSLQSVSFADAQGSNVTTTGLAVLGGVSTSLIPTLDAALSLGSASLRWNAVLADVTSTSATTTNLFANTAAFLAVSSTSANFGTASVDNLSFVNGTSTGWFGFNAASGSSLTASTIAATVLSAGSASLTQLIVSNATFTQLAVSSLNILGSTPSSFENLVWTNATGTNTTSTNLYAQNFQAGGASVGSLNVSGTSTLQGVFFTNGTGTNVTVTGIASTSQLYVNGKLPCLADGTNCPSGTTPNLQTVTNAGNTTTNAIVFNGGTSTGAFVFGSTVSVSSTLTVLGSSSFQSISFTDAQGSNVTTTGLAVLGGVSTALIPTLDAALSLGSASLRWNAVLADVTSTSVTTTNLFANSLYALASTVGSLTATGTTSLQSLTFTNATGSTLFASTLHASNGTFATALVGSLTATGTTSLQSLTFTNATGAVLAVGDLTSTGVSIFNAATVGSATVGNLTATGTTSLQGLTFTNATGSSVTSTNLFATNAQFGTVSSTSANFGAATVNGQLSAGSVSTSQLFVNGVAIAGSSSETLASVSARGSSATSTLQLFGGFVGASSTVTSTLTVLGSSSFQSISFTDAQGSNVTTTGLAVLGGVSTSLIPTLDAALSLGSASLRWNAVLADVTSTSVTTTNLFANSLYALASTVGNLTATGTTSLQSLTFTNATGSTLFASTVQGTNGTFTTALVGGLTATGTTSLQGVTFATAAGTSLTVAGATVGNFTATGTASLQSYTFTSGSGVSLVAASSTVGSATVGSLTATGTTSLQSLTFTDASGNAVTTTNLFATNAQFGSVSSTSANFGSATVSGQLSAGSVSTSQLFVNGVAVSVNSDTLASVSNRGASATTTLQLFGGFIGASSTVTSTLTVLGSTSLQGLSFTNAQGSNVTTTGLAVLGGVSTSLIPTLDAALSLGSASLRWNAVLADVTSTAVTTTNLFANTAALLAVSSTSATFGSASADALSFVNGTSTGWFNFASATGSSLAATVLSAGNATLAQLIATNATLTNLAVSSLTITGSAPSSFANLIWTNATGTNTTSTNLYAQNFQTPNGQIGSATIGALNVTGTTSLQDATFSNATGTNIATTNLSATGVVSTSQLYVNGRLPCLADGTNCPSGTTPNLQTVTNAGNTTTNAIVFNGGTSTGAFTFSSAATVSGNFAVLGSSALQNVTFTDATATNVTTTGLAVLGGVSTSLIPTLDAALSLGSASLRWNANLAAVNATSVTTTNLFANSLYALASTVGSLTATGTTSLQSLTFTDATGSTLFASTVQASNGTFSTALVGGLTATGTTSLQGLTFTDGQGTNVTTTNLFANGAQFGTVSSTSANFGSATVGGQLSAGSVSTSQLFVNGVAVTGSGSETLASVSARGSSATATLQLLGGFVAASSTVTSTLTVLGSSAFQSISFTNAQGSNVTTTGLAVLGGVSTSLIPTLDAALSLGSASLRWNAVLANATATSVTTTNLFANSLYALASTVGSLTATGTTSLQSLTFTNATGSTLFASTVQGSSGTFSTALVGSLTATGTTALQALTFTDATGSSLSVGSLTATGVSVLNAAAVGSATIGSLTATGTTSLQSLTFTDASGNAVTTTNLFATNGQFGNLSSTNASFGSVTATSLTLTGSAPSSFANLVWTNATGTNTTSTNLFATNFQASAAVLSSLSFTQGTSTGWFGFGTASGSSVYALAGNFATATVMGQAVCLANGVGCPTSAASAETLASVSNRGASATATLQLLGGFIAASSTVTSTLTVLGSTSLQDLSFANAQGSNVTTTGLAVSGVVSTNLLPSIDAALSLGSSGLRWNAVLANATATSVTTTNLFATNGQFGNLSGSFLSVSGQTTLGNVTMANVTATAVTTTNLFASVLAFNGASGASLSAGSATIGSATVGNLTATGTTSLQGLTFTNATGTSVTTTNLFANDAQFGTVSSTSANFGSATVNGQLSAGSVSTSQLFVNGVAITGSSSDTLASVSARGSFATTTLQLFGGFVGASSTVTSTLTVLGSSSFQSIAFTDAQGSNVTTTGLAVLGGVSTSLIPTLDAALSLGSASLRWNAVLADVTSTSVTTTNLFANSLYALASTVGSLTATGTTSLQSLTFTDATGSTLFASTVQASNGTFATALVGGLTATGTTSLQGVTFTTAAGTSLTVAGATVGSATVGNLTATGTTSLQSFSFTSGSGASLVVASSTVGSATVGNLTATGTSVFNIATIGTATAGDLTATGTTGLQSLTFTNGTATSVTTTNLFATNGQFGNVSSTSASFGSAAVNGQLSAGSVSTSQIFLNGQAVDISPQTLASVSARGSSATTTLQLFGGFVGASSTVTSTLTVLGSSAFQSISFTNAQGSNVTTTGLAVLGGVSTALIPTIDASVAIGSASLRWNANLASATATSVTTTNLFANSLYALVSTVGSLTATGTSGLQSLTFTNATGSSLFASTVQGSNGIFSTALVGSLTATGTTSLQALGFTNATGSSLSLTSSSTVAGAFNVGGQATIQALSFTQGTSTGWFGFGTASGSNLFVGGSPVCRSNGIGCPTGSLVWSDNSASGFVSLSTSSRDLVIGASASATAPFYFDIGSPSSSLQIGRAGNANLFVGTSTYGGGLSSLFALNGDDAFIQGNLGVASSVYSNGSFVAGSNAVTTTVYGSRLVTTNGDELVLEQTGDELGATRLRLQSRFGATGAMFEQGNASIPLIDFGFNPGPRQSNMRVEARPGSLLLNSGQEFQWLINATDTTTYVQFVMSSSSAAFQVPLAVNSLSVGLFTLTVGGSVGPATDNAYDLGSASTSWRNVYASGTGTFGQLAVNGPAVVDGRLSIGSSGVVTSTNWLNAGLASGTIESIRSLIAYKGHLYAGRGDSAGDGDVMVCDPTFGGNSVACDVAADWSTSTDSGTASQVLDLKEYQSRLYAAQGNGAGLGLIRICTPETTGSALLCDSGDWSTATTTSFTRIRDLEIYGGYMYAAADTGVANSASVIACNPAGGGNANDCDNAADWTNVALPVAGYEEATDLVVYLNRLYAFVGNSSQDNDIFVCTPTAGGNASRCDSTADWTRVLNNTTAGIASYEAAAVYNGDLYLGQGNGAGDGDLLRCQAFRAGDPTLCDNTTDVTTVINNAGTVTRVPALYPYAGILFVGQEGTTAGAGDINELEQTFATTTDPTANYEATYDFVDFNGYIYAGRGNATNKGTVSYRRVARRTSQDIYFDSGSSTGSFWFEEKSKSSVPSLSEGVFKLSHGLITEAGAYDVAEMMAAAEVGLEPGDVISLVTTTSVGVVRSNLPYDPQFLGVISTNPALLFSAKNAENAGMVPVAIGGRVAVKFSNENGGVAIGDALTTASTTGYAMKATGFGPMIGRAMEPFEEGQEATGATGTIMMFVQPGFHVASQDGVLTDLPAVGQLRIGLDSLPLVGPSAVAQFSGATDTYLQVNVQNGSSGTSASSDYVATNDIGDDASYYIDMGINSSGYANPEFAVQRANDGYLYVHGGNLVMGTASSADILFHTGGLLEENERVRITADGKVGIGTAEPLADLHVSGTAMFSAVSFGDATGTNVTTTGLAVLGGVSTSLIPTLDQALSLGAASLRWNAQLGSVDALAVTTTDLYAFRLLSTVATVGNLTATGTASLQGFTFTAATGASLSVSGSVSTTELFVNGKRVCLEDGTNCKTDQAWSASSTASTSVGAETLLLTVTSTPASTSAGVWVSAQGRAINAAALSASTVTIRIRRGGTSCTTGVQVGVDRIVEVAASESEDITASFLDFPATSTAVVYRMCGLGSGGTPSVGGRSMVVQNIVAGADLAEAYFSDQELKPGEVVSLDPAAEDRVRRSPGARRTDAIGVVSTRPGQVLAEAPVAGGEPVLIALAGRVPVLVTAENGAIRPGDALTTASVPGRAMRATEAGPMVGRALSGFAPTSGTTSTEEAAVMMFVQPGYFFPLEEGDSAELSATDTQALQDAATVEEVHPAASTDIVELLQVASLSVKDVVATGRVVMEGELRLRGPVVFSSVNAGSVSVAPGETKVHVAFAAPYPYVPRVVVTPEVEDVSRGLGFADDVWDGGYYLSRVTADGFDVRLPRGYCATVGDCPIRLRFNWFVTAMEGESASSTPSVPEAPPSAEDPAPAAEPVPDPEVPAEAAPDQPATSTEPAPEEPAPIPAEDPAPAPEAAVEDPAPAASPAEEPSSEPVPAPDPAPAQEPAPAE